MQWKFEATTGSLSPTQKIVDLENSKLYPTLLYYSLKLLFVAYFTGEMNAKVVGIKVFYNGIPK